MRNDDELAAGEGGSHEETEKRLNPQLQLTSDLSQFADRVGAFAARSTGLDRDTVMFAAGRASTGTMPVPAGSISGWRLRTWQAATAAMSLVAGCLAIALVTRPVPEPRVVVVERQRVLADSSQEVAGSRAQQSPEVANSISPADDGQSQSDDDVKLAEAWKARQEMIAQGEWRESRLALAPLPLQAATFRNEAPGSTEPPLTRAGVMGEGSRQTIQSLLGEKL